MSITQKLPLSWRLSLARFVPGRNAGRERGGQRKHLTLVAPPGNTHGWILDAICREIAANAPADKVSIVNTDADTFPDSDAYFFTHTGFFRDVLLRHPWIAARRNLVFFTHPENKNGLDRKKTAMLLNRADVVISMCELFKTELVQDGVNESSIDVATIGADPELFPRHVRGQGKIGLCSGYVPRKDGERIFEIVRAMPERQFVLCGRKWREWSKFEALCGLPNFDYVELPYSEYPQFYRGLDVFLTVSKLEGGPVPLVEAMMSNVVPVASRTGIAPEIITDGKNGYTFDVEAPLETIVEHINKAFEIETDIRQTVQHLTWQRFSSQIQKLAGIAAGHDA